MGLHVRTPPDRSSAVVAAARALLLARAVDRSPVNLQAGGPFFATAFSIAASIVSDGSAEEFSAAIAPHVEQYAKLVIYALDRTKSAGGRLAATGVRQGYNQTSDACVFEMRAFFSGLEPEQMKAALVSDPVQ